ncbi:MAG: hypothetical protein ACOCSE_01520, partial [Chitinivibrionales bacterium]
LETYRKCTLENTGTDAADLYKWLIRTCERMKLFDYEVETIDSSSFSDHEKGSYYFDVAKRSFLNSRYGTAVKAGKRVLNHSNDTSVHKEVAALLYQSYMNRDMKGRALNWMKKSGFKDDPETKRVEITLLQEKGFLDKADSSIAELPESTAKDTLRIRNLVFRNKPEDAYKLSKKIKENRRDEGLIWEMRTALYSGKVSTAALLLDSTAYLDNNDYTEGRVREKLMIERLKGNRDLLKLYGEIRRLLFTGGLEKAIDTLRNHKAGIKEKIPLFEAVIEEIQKRDGYSLSLSALQSIPEERFSDKLLFLFGKACIQAGRIQEAETAFNRVIQESGNQVFKRKAGTYLLKIEKSLAM